MYDRPDIHTVGESLFAKTTTEKNNINNNDIIMIKKIRTFVSLSSDDDNERLRSEHTRH